MSLSFPSLVGRSLRSVVDNIFIGHDAAQAKKFAAETFHVKKPLEQAAEGSDDSEDDDEPSALVDKIRLKVYEFIRESSAHPASG